MVAYSFKRRFVPKILDRTKDHTIRAVRKRHARIGEPVQLYYAQRTKHCLAVGLARCAAVLPVTLAFADGGFVVLNGNMISHPPALDSFATSDGFDSWPQMKTFWHENHGDETFYGVLIRWTAFQPARGMNVEFFHGFASLAEPAP